MATATDEAERWPSLRQELLAMGWDEPELALGPHVIRDKLKRSLAEGWIVAGQRHLFEAYLEAIDECIEADQWA